jgi:hypothetical protein
MAEHQLFTSKSPEKGNDDCVGAHDRFRDSVNFDDAWIRAIGKPEALPSLTLGTGDAQHPSLPHTTVENMSEGNPTRFFPRPEPHEWWNQDLVGSACSSVGDLIGHWIKELYEDARPELIKSCRFIGKEALAVKKEIDSVIAEVQKPDPPGGR